MSDEELEARLKEICLSTPGRGLEDALRCGKAARARREWAGLARLAAAAVVAWLLSAAAGAAVDRSIATIHQAPDGTVVAKTEPGRTSPGGALAVVWQRRQIEQMAFEDWAPDWRLEYGGPMKRERDDRQGFFWGKPFERVIPQTPFPNFLVLLSSGSWFSAAETGSGRLGRRRKGLCASREGRKRETFLAAAVERRRSRELKAQAISRPFGG